MKQRSDPSPDSEIEVMDATIIHDSAIRAHSDKTHLNHRAILPHVFGMDNTYQHGILDAALDPDGAQNRPFRSLLRVACRKDVVLGYVLVIWSASKDCTSPTDALIADIGTLEEGRGQGIGALLLADIKGQMQARHWASLTADVWQDNAASHRLFDSSQFTAERTEYRFGTPAPRADDAPDGPKRDTTWIYLAVLFGGGALLAYFGR